LLNFCHFSPETYEKEGKNKKQAAREKRDRQKRQRQKRKKERERERSQRRDLWKCRQPRRAVEKIWTS